MRQDTAACVSLSSNHNVKEHNCRNTQKSQQIDFRSNRAKRSEQSPKTTSLTILRMLPNNQPQPSTFGRDRG
jgi:hypothetical protein